MTDEPQPTPEAPKLKVGGEVRVARLNSLVACRAELGRLYREARRRHGRFPDALTASRLANVLGAVQTVIELVELEKRIKALEERPASSPPVRETSSRLDSMLRQRFGENLDG
jgi:hypothetical protein